MFANGSARMEDINGFVEIQGNPLSKVGVFPYLGCQIDPALQPDKIYYVYRPEEELSNPECIKSFRLSPWIDEHIMLGEGGVPAEQKGVEGVIGENVYYDAPYLKGNLKIFSNSLANLIENGKKELSIGYRCLYELTPGVYNGQRYDAIQRCIRGNHVALVTEGRAGPDVAVLDSFKITLDEAIMDKLKDQKVTNAADEGEGDAPAKDEENASSTASDIEKVTELLSNLQGPLTKLLEVMGKFGAAAVATPIEQEDEEDPSISNTAGTAMDAKLKESMDAQIKSLNAKIENLEKQNNDIKSNAFKSFVKEFTERDSLVDKLAPIVGTFDHKNMTMDEVAKYGVKKLGLECQEGHEQIMLKGYFAAQQPVVVEDAKIEEVNTSNVSPLIAAFNASQN